VRCWLASANSDEGAADRLVSGMGRLSSIGLISIAA
jgi:hypothetical protein